MGLFGLFNVPKYKKTEEDIKRENPEWFFSEDCEKLFKRSIRLNWDNMFNEWNNGGASNMYRYTAYSIKDLGDESFPITFFADYFRSLKTMDNPMICMNAVDFAYTKEAGGCYFYPECFEKEGNPIVNFAIKIKPIINHKNGKELWLNGGMKSIIAYLHDVSEDVGLRDGLEESNQEWIYKESLWFDSKGKERKDSEILADIKANVKHPEIVLNF